MNILRGQIGDFRLDAHVRVESSDLARGGNCLGQRFRCVSFVEERLSLEVAGLYVIAVDDQHLAHASTSQQSGNACSRGATTDNDNPGRTQFLLPLRTDAGEEYLPGIPIF